MMSSSIGVLTHAEITIPMIVSQRNERFFMTEERLVSLRCCPGGRLNKGFPHNELHALRIQENNTVSFPFQLFMSLLVRPRTNPKNKSVEPTFVYLVGGLAGP